MTRVKKMVMGGSIGDEEFDSILVVPEELDAKDAMMAESMQIPFPVLCECYSEPDADRIVELWNAKYGSQ